MFLRMSVVAALVALTNMDGVSGQNDAMLFTISQEEKAYLQQVWRIFVGRKQAFQDVQTALVATLKQTPDLLTIFKCARGKTEDWESASKITAVVLETTNQFFDVFMDDRQAERLILDIAVLFHGRSVAIEELFLFTSGMVIGSIADTTNNPMSAPIFTRLMFAISVLLSGPSQPGSFFNLSPRERDLMRHSWEKYGQNPTALEDVILEWLETNVGSQQQVWPEMANVPPKNLKQDNRFKTNVINVISRVTYFVNNLSRKPESTDMVREAAIQLYSMNLSLMGTLFGGGLATIGSMKSVLPKDFTVETEAAWMKFLFSLYPTISDIETFGVYTEYADSPNSVANEPRQPAPCKC